MKIIVDTNISFSALKSESPFGDVILNTPDVFEFFQ